MYLVGWKLLWFATVFNMLEGILHWLPIIKCDHRCFSRLGAKGPVITPFNPLAVQRCMLYKQGFSSPVCQAVMGITEASATKSYQQCWKEWAFWCAWEDYQTMSFLSLELAEYLVLLLRVGLAWCTFSIDHPAISAFLEPHHHCKASNHPVISKVMLHLYLQETFMQTFWPMECWMFLILVKELGPIPLSYQF